MMPMQPHNVCHDERNDDRAGHDLNKLGHGKTDMASRKQELQLARWTRSLRELKDVEDRAIVSIDVEVVDYRQDILKEIGITAVTPSGTVTSANFVIREHLNVYSRFQTGGKKLTAHRYGTQRYLSVHLVKRLLRETFEYTEKHNWKTIVVAHNITSDVKFLENAMHVKYKFPDNLTLADTQEMHAAWRHKWMRMSLKNTVNDLGWNPVATVFHNSGNDSWWTARLAEHLLIQPEDPAQD
jgi:DNA polymerase III alpha subunit (gram-positive type)